MQNKYINRYLSCLHDLQLANDRDPSDTFVLSGTVLKFCLTFDIAWKIMKDVITKHFEVSDFALGSPSQVLKQAYAIGIISDKIWMRMLRTSNNLVHDYNVTIAASSFDIIINEYVPIFVAFESSIAKYYTTDGDIARSTSF